MFFSQTVNHTLTLVRTHSLSCSGQYWSINRHRLFAGWPHQAMLEFFAYVYIVFRRERKRETLLHAHSLQHIVEDVSRS